MSDFESKLELEKLQPTQIVYVVNGDDFKIHKCECIISDCGRDSVWTYTMNGKNYSNDDYPVYLSYKEAFDTWKNMIENTRQELIQKVASAMTRLSKDQELLDKLNKLIVLF